LLENACKFSAAACKRCPRSNARDHVKALPRERRAVK
jgi:hypothetical protein